MADDNVDIVDRNKPAPWLEVPSRAISAVEHPSIIKNVDKAITSLGGIGKLSKVETHPVTRSGNYMQCTQPQS